VVHEKELRDEIWNKSLSDVRIVVEEVECLEATDMEFSDSGYVFYIEEEASPVETD
jgi:hypothetical protein